MKEQRDFDLKHLSAESCFGYENECKSGNFFVLAAMGQNKKCMWKERTWRSSCFAYIRFAEQTIVSLSYRKMCELMRAFTCLTFLDAFYSEAIVQMI